MFFHKRMIFLILAVTLGLLTMSFTHPFRPRNPPCPLITLGGGYYFAGPNHSGGVIQGEYRFGKYYFNCIRPQVTLILPEFKSIFLGVGIGLEWYLGSHFIVIPSFEPGLYTKCKSGRNLGYPIEFRSSIELAYECGNGFRLGFQGYHISNARLGKHNPGANALVFYAGFPTCFFCR